ncbi:MAG: hypothetical protein M0Z50_17040 [Planctomycetia bacterium]|nr:hypothetical protein [Planctomycetia bacterium]
MNRKTNQPASTNLPEKTSKLSVEIFRLMREGDVDSRNKAQELLRSAMTNSLSPATRNNSGGK